MLQNMLYLYSDFYHTAWWSSQQYIAKITKPYGTVDSMGLIAILNMSHIPIRIVKTKTTVAKNPQSAINCHKILFVCVDNVQDTS